MHRRGIPQPGVVHVVDVVGRRAVQEGFGGGRVVQFDRGRCHQFGGQLELNKISVRRQIALELIAATTNLRRRAPDQPGTNVLLTNRVVDQLEGRPCAMHSAVKRLRLYSRASTRDKCFFELDDFCTLSLFCAALGLKLEKKLRWLGVIYDFRVGCNVKTCFLG